MNVRNRSHAVTVEVLVEEGTVPEGVLVALGSVLGGWSVHVLDGRLRYVHNLYGKTRHTIVADDVLGPGRHSLRFDFEKDGLDVRYALGGTGRLSVDGEVVAEGDIDRFTPSSFNGVGVGLTCGYEWGPAVGEGYTAPFPFNGTHPPGRGGDHRTGGARSAGRAGRHLLRAVTRPATGATRPSPVGGRACGRRDLGEPHHRRA